MLLRFSEEKNALIVDTRLSAQSKNETWRKDNLIRVFGENYFHLPEWGNLNYKDLEEPIVINKFDEGLKLLLPYFYSNRNIVLMCVCKKLETCHRFVLSERLKQMGFLITHLSKKDLVSNLESEQTIQLSFF